MILKLFMMKNSSICTTCLATPKVLMQRVYKKVLETYGKDEEK